MHTEPVKKIIAMGVLHSSRDYANLYSIFLQKCIVRFCIFLYRVVSFFAPISCFNIILFYAHFVIFFDFWTEITLNKGGLPQNTSYFHTCLPLAKTSKITIFYLSFRIDSDTYTKQPPFNQQRLVFITYLSNPSAGHKPWFLYQSSRLRYGKSYHDCIHRFRLFGAKYQH